MNCEEIGKLVYQDEDTKEYKAFVNKFKPKRTTDDCFTPPEVYEVVKKWVLEKCPQVAGLKVVRPFYPNGDYKAEDYTDSVVIDNPPFSILAEIKNFYRHGGIPFFLFAHSLTLFSRAGEEVGVNYIIPDADITYQNGANVRTSFVSNLFGDDVIILAPDLGQSIKQAQAEAKVARGEKKRLVYKYPKNLISSALLQKYVSRGVQLTIKRHEVHYVEQLDSQIKHNKKIYGRGYLISDHVVKVLEEARKEAEVQKEQKEEEPDNIWELSERERNIIEELNNNRG